jgi:O-antigen ligase
MTLVDQYGWNARIRDRLGWPLTAALLAGAAGIAVVVAFLLGLGLWHLALVLLVVAPAFYVLSRYPLAALMVWLVVDPLLMAIEGGGAARQLYWLVHRALPVGALMLIVLGRLIGVRRERFHKLGWPEMMVAGYFLLTVVSIAYRSPDSTATYIYMWDHVFVPLSIYMLIRLLAPDEYDLRRLVPFFAFFLVTQAVIGGLSIVAPGILPESYLNREFRTTGTLRHPNVYGVSLLFAGLYVAHWGQVVENRPRLRGLANLAAVLAAGMGIATLSRATWLAVLVVVFGLLFIYPHLTRRIMAFGVATVLVALFMGGIMTDVGDALNDRLRSEETALSRLPVIVASLRMIEAKPIFGFGYENFDRFDQEYQGSIEGVFVPDKDHASHNFFLTLGAEGGLVGLFLYLGPVLWAAVKTFGGLDHLPKTGFRSQRLVWLLWLALAAQAVAFNFSNNRVAFGLAMWWITVGLLVSLCDWTEVVAERANGSLHKQVEALNNGHSGSLEPVP